MDRTIRLTTGVSRLMHSPTIVEGQLSSTGKTISMTVNQDNPGLAESYRLNAERILDGDTLSRDGRYFELYTKEDFRQSQRANHSPGPTSGANEVTDTENLPEPTHA